MQLDSGDVELVRRIRLSLHELADPERAPQMQAYMKSTMPFLGVRVPQVRAAVRAHAKRRPASSPEVVIATVGLIWDEATFREERYAGTALLDVPSARALRTPPLIELHERLIVEGAWWDHVDEVSHRVGELLTAFPADVEPVVRRWQRSPDQWLRRSSIICQLGLRDRTDLRLLRDAIDANVADRDFFIRKAIGWALRDYARTDPAWVRAFLESRPGLSPLSRREAAKHL